MACSVLGDNQDFRSTNTPSLTFQLMELAILLAESDKGLLKYVTARIITIMVFILILVLILNMILLPLLNLNMMMMMMILIIVTNTMKMTTITITIMSSSKK